MLANYVGEMVPDQGSKVVANACMSYLAMCCLQLRERENIVDSNMHHVPLNDAVKVDGGIYFKSTQVQPRRLGKAALQLHPLRYCTSCKQACRAC